APELAFRGFEEFHSFQTFLSLAHPMALTLRGPRMEAHGIEGSTYALADLARRQLVTPGRCFGGPEIGEELRRLAREWQALGRPGMGRVWEERAWCGWRCRGSGGRRRRPGPCPAGGGRWGRWGKPSNRGWCARGRPGCRGSCQRRGRSFTAGHGAPHPPSPSV